MKFLCDTCQWNNERYCWDSRRPNVAIDEGCKSYSSIIERSAYQLPDNKYPFGEPLLGLEEKLKKKKS